MLEQYLSAIRYYCNYRERCHEEVRYKLVEIGARGEELEQLMLQMITENLLNEERYARAYVSGKFRINHWGRNKIVQQLKQKKISAYCIQKGLQEIDEEDYKNTLQLLISQKHKELSKERQPAIRNQKVFRYALQKGYESNLIAEALKNF